MRMAAPPSTLEAALAAGIRAGDRATLARAITLIESKRADHRQTAHLLVQELLPLTGKAVRLGITGAPGAGKSTTIDALGTYADRARPQGGGAGGRSVVEPHRRLDPRRQDPHGAARHRPATPSSGPRPPPARSAASPAKTRETMLLCEAAGYDV